MSISNEAVEAAARAIHEAGDWDVSWVGDDWRAECARAEARAALEAAAPHMLAEAWDEGEAAGQDNRDSNRGYNIEHKYNPYRSQA